MQGPERSMRTANHGSQRLGAMLFRQDRQARCNVVQGFIPGHALPLVRTALPHTLQGVVHAIRAIERLQVHAPTAATCQGGFAVGITGRVNFDVHNTTIFHRGQKATKIAAEVAIGSFNFLLSHYSALSSDELRGTKALLSEWLGMSSNRKRSFIYILA